MDNHLKEALNDFKKRKILVMGDIILDRFTWGVIERVNPEQNAAPLVKVVSESYILGGAANVASNIASLSAKVSLYGFLGNDSYSKEIQRLCQEQNIQLHTFYNNQPTIVKQRIMADRQQVTRVDFGETKLGTLSRKIQEEILDELNNTISEHDLIILSDYNKGFFDSFLSRGIIETTNSYKIPILVDLKPANMDFFNGCTIICPNEREAQEMSGIKYQNGNETLSKIGKKLSERMNSQYVIITCGKDGAFSYHNGSSEHIPTFAKQVSDVTGAGDTFAAALALGFSSGLSIHDSTRLANYAASIVVEKVGTATASLEELISRIENKK